MPGIALGYFCPALASLEPFVGGAVGGGDAAALSIRRVARRLCLNTRAFAGPRPAHVAVQPKLTDTRPTLVVGRPNRLQFFQLSVVTHPSPRHTGVVRSLAVGHGKVVPGIARGGFVLALLVPRVVSNVRAAEPLPRRAIRGTDRAALAVLGVVRRSRFHLRALRAGRPWFANAVVKPVVSGARSALVVARTFAQGLQHSVGTHPSPRHAGVVAALAVCGRHVQVVPDRALGCLALALAAVKPFVGQAVGGVCRAALPVPRIVRRQRLHLRAFRTFDPRLTRISVEPVAGIARLAIVVLDAQ